MAIKDVMQVNVPVLPIPAIKKPPAAWPVTDAESQAPWFQVVAFCKSFFGTMDAIITLKQGPTNDLMIPVQNITA